MPFEQNGLIEGILNVNPNIVMVLLSENAVEMPWVKKVLSIVQGWYPDSESGNAPANVLSGKVNPSGKFYAAMNHLICM